MLYTLIEGMHAVLCYDKSKRVFLKLKLSFEDLDKLQSMGASWRALM